MDHVYFSKWYVTRTICWLKNTTFVRDCRLTKKKEGEIERFSFGGKQHLLEMKTCKIIPKWLDCSILEHITIIHQLESYVDDLDWNLVFSDFYAVFLGVQKSYYVWMVQVSVTLHFAP